MHLYRLVNTESNSIEKAVIEIQQDKRHDAGFVEEPTRKRKTQLTLRGKASLNESTVLTHLFDNCDSPQKKRKK
jgi:hypothetical protein